MHPITHAATRPDHPAIIMAGSGEQVSFGELDATANRFARLLRARGLGRGDHFALLMENNALYLQLVWGSQRAGTMMVPVSTRLTAPEIAYILRDAGVKLLVTSRKYADIAASALSECPDCGVLVLGSGQADDLEAALAAQDGAPLADPVPGQYMLYSSGTTGRPKGVKPRPPESEDVTAVNPLVGLAVMGAGWPTDGSMVYLSPAPLYHAAPLGWCSTAHRLGATIVVMEKFEPEHALATIEKYRVTDSQWVPTHFVRMLKLPDEVRTRYDLSSHRRAIHAAAPCPVPVKRAMIEWWGPIIIEYYAGSEGIGMTLIKSEDWLAHPGSVGKAIHGTIHVCGPDGEELPAGQDGLLYFEIDTTPTYHNDPAKTAEAMHARGWMTLGDIGHMDADGYLYLTDRKSHMIISGGVNIYPQEIENLLVTHPKVMDAAVIGAPEPDLGEQVVAVVQPVDMALAGPSLEEELRDFLSPQLSRVKMPRLFDFRPELPREANGKLYKRELRDEYAARASSHEVAEPAGGRGVTAPARLSPEDARAVIDPASYADWDGLLDRFDRIRAATPVALAQAPENQHPPFWLVSGYDEVMRISKDNATFLNNPRTVVFSLTEGIEFAKAFSGGSEHMVASLVTFDAPVHLKYRKLTQEWFMPKNLRTLEGEIRAIAEATVQRMIDAGPEMDFCKLVSQPYPLHVVMQILGVPEEDEARMLTLTQQMFGGQDEDLNQSGMKDLPPEVITQIVAGAVKDFEAYFARLTAEKRAHPTGDVASQIANAVVDGEPLNDRDMMGYYIIVAAAGHDTTSASTAGAMLALARDPAQWARVKADRSLLGGIVEEAIRWTTPVQHFMRTAAQDVELGGQQIAAGDWLMLNYVAANHDPAVFDEPRRFDAARSPNRHLAFGAGAHQCLGLHLARLEMRILFETLLDRIATIELAGEPARAKSTFVGGLKRLPLRFSVAS